MIKKCRKLLILFKVFNILFSVFIMVLGPFPAGSFPSCVLPWFFPPWKFPSLGFFTPGWKITHAPPTLFRFVARFARVRIRNSSRNRFASTAYFAWGGNFRGGSQGWKIPGVEGKFWSSIIDIRRLISLNI